MLNASKSASGSGFASNKAAAVAAGPEKLAAAPGTARRAPQIRLEYVPSRLRRRASCRAVLLSTAAFGLALSLLIASSAWAAGGAGGAGEGNGVGVAGGGAGGAGGSGYAGVAGDNGFYGSLFGGGGGGGGAGGGTGGTGGIAGTGVTDYGGAGGDGGTNGESAQAIPGASLIEGAPGSAGGGAAGTGGGGGGGGAGGYAAIVTGSTDNRYAASIYGGAGGAGGEGYNGGGGGDGGDGVFFSVSGASFANTGIIFGGAGGAGGQSDGLDVAGGSGGAGGVAVAGQSLALDNGGEIFGGEGGMGGLGGDNALAGAVGAGGAGVMGSGLTIVNNGSIEGGLTGDDVTEADAIDFTGGANFLTSNSGMLVGDIEIDSGSLTLLQTAAGGATGSASYSNVVAGAGSLIVTTDPNYSVTLSGANTYTGGTTLTAGELVIDDDSALGTGALAMDAGTTLSFAPDNNLTIANDISISGDPTFAPGAGAVQTITGVISDGVDQGVLDMQGPGTLVLSGVNTYTGATTISSGTLALSGSGSIAASSGVADNGIFDISNTTSGASIESLSGSGVVSLGGEGLTLTAASGIFSGAIGGAGALTLAGGTETLSGANTYSGGTTLSGGVLQVASDGALGTGSLAFDGGTLQAGAPALTIANAATIDANGGSIDSDGYTLTYAGVISDASGDHGALTVLDSVGGGVVVFNAAETYTGGTTISGGTLQLGDGTSNGSVVGAIADNTNLTLDPNGSQTFANVVSGSGSLTMIGAGTAILNSADTYTGGTTISGGTLQLGDGTSNGSVVGAIADNANLTLDPNGSQTFANVVSGSGSLTMTGAGTAILTAAETYTGGTTISGGTLQLGDGTSNGSVVGAIADNANLTLDPNGSQTFANVVSGSGSLTMTGAGTAILTAAETYTGGTTISGGTLQLGDGTSNGSVVGAIADNANLTLDPNGSQTFANVVSGSGSLTMTGAGTAILTAAETYTGGTNIDAGTLALSGSGSIAASSGVADGGTFDISQTTGASIVSLSGSGVVDLGAQTLTLTNADGAFSGALSGTGGLAVSGGSETLSNANSYTGATTIANDATLALSNAGSIADSSNVADGGTFDISNTTSGASIESLSGSGVVSLGGESLTLTAASGTFSGAIGGAGALTLAGGTETLSGANTYSGGTTLAGGVLQIASDGALGTGSLAFDGGTLQAGAPALTIANAATIESGDMGTIDSNGQTLVYSGTIGGAGGLTAMNSVSDVGSVTLTGDDVYTGATTIEWGATLALLGSGAIADSSGVADTGTLDISGTNSGASIVSLSGSGDVDLGAQTLTLTNAADRFYGAISGTGGLAVSGGSEILSNANSYTGATTIASGAALALSGAGSIADSSGVADDGAFDISNTTGASIVSLSGAGGVDLGAQTLTLTDAADTFAGAISGTGGLTLTDGMETLSGANAYTGVTTISGGTLALSGAGSIADSSGVADDGTFDISQTTSGASIVSLSGSGGVDLGAQTLTLTDAADTFAGAISGTGGLAVSGGSETLSNANSYTGATTIAGGAALALSGAGSIAGSSGVADNGVFDISQTTTGASIVSLSGSGDVDLGAQTLTLTNADGAFSGALSGTGGLTLAAGTQTLSGASSYSGTTTVAGGADLALGDALALGTSELVLQTGSTLSFTADGLTIANDILLPDLDPTIDTGADSETLAGAISGPGGLTKEGSGALTLSGDDAYSGATTVAAGALVVTGSIANSAATVDSGATLGGSGTVASLSALSGATVAPGVVAPYSTLTVANGVSFASGSTYEVDVDAAGANDEIVAGGAATLAGGAVVVNAASGSYAAQTQYTILSASGGVTGAFAGVTTNQAFLSPSLSYSSDAVELALTRNDISFASVGATSDQQDVGGAIQALGVGNALFEGVVNLTAAQAQAAFDSASGEIHASALSEAAEDSRLPREAVLDRLSGPFGGLSGSFDGGASGAVATTASPSAAPTPYTVWGRGFGDFGRLGGDGNAASLQRSLGGAIVGVDTDPNSQTRIGVAAGYTQSTMTIDARGSSGSVGSAFGGFYGATGFGPLNLRGGALFAADQFATNRAVALPGFSDSDVAAYGGETLQAFGEAGWRVTMKQATIEPFAGLLALRVDADGFNETGGAAALSGQAASFEETATTLGARFATTPFAGLPLTASGMLGWRHAFGDVTPQAVLAFESGASNPFTIAGVPIARNSLAAEAGLGWRLSQLATVGLSYSGDIAAHDSDNAVEAKLDVSF